MNIIHTLRRALGLHPLRRAGEPDHEPNARSAAELVAMIQRDKMYGRRYSDPIDVRDAHRPLTKASTSGKQ